MTLKALTIVVLRLYAITYFFEAVVLALYTLGSEQYSSVNEMLSELFYPSGLLVFAGVLWLIARHIAALVTRGIDGPLPFTALTREDIYCCAFVILGLYFVQNSIGITILELFQYAERVGKEYIPDSAKNQVTASLVKHALTVIIGLACIIGAPVWTRKLLRLEQKKES